MSLLGLQKRTPEEREGLHPKNALGGMEAHLLSLQIKLLIVRTTRERALTYTLHESAEIRIPQEAN